MELLPEGDTSSNDMGSLLEQYILLLGLMQRESLEKIWADVKRTTIPLVVSGLKLWSLAHCVTYGLIPVENRLLWVDFVEIVWVTILAAQAAGVGSDLH